MKWVEPAGLIKFDFLGLKTLTVLAMASNLVRRRSPEFNLENIALDDRRNICNAWSRRNNRRIPT